MRGNYPVFLGRERVGEIQLQQNGLYYGVECKCSLPGTSIFRLYAKSSDRKYRIGIPVPEGDGYALRANIRFGKNVTEDLRFFVVEGEDRSKRQRIPICEDKPFQQMERLEDMTFVRNDGIPCLVLKENHDHSLLDA